MLRFRRPARSLTLCAAALALLPAAAEARYGAKKAITGPFATIDGRSAFGTYRDLGAGIFQYKLRWDFVAQTKPRRGDDPGERSYEWPDELDFIVEQSRQSRMKVAVTVVGTPRWANGGKDFRFAPAGTRTFADFVEAASRRYPGVRIWVIGDEVNSRNGFQPLTPATFGQRLDPVQTVAPRRYARLLDAAYGALKAVDRKDVVVGGNTVSFGDVPPKKWIDAMVLPDGQPPRMDVYGHVPYSGRPPVQGVLPPLGDGRADIADLPYLLNWIEQDATRDGADPLPVFFTKWYVPSDHGNGQFDFFVTREEQAAYLRDAFAVARSTPRVYAIGWEAFQDEPARADGFENLGGLADAADQPKPSYFAYREG